METFSTIKRVTVQIFFDTVTALLAAATLLSVFVYIRKTRTKNASTSSSNPSQVVVAPVKIALYTAKLQPMVAPCVSSRTRGLLERRGSSASLTIDLRQSGSSIVEPSPIYENDAAEGVELKKPSHLTRHQLRHFDVKASLPTIYAEFAMLPNPSTSSCEKVVGCSQKNRHTVWPIRETRVRLSTSYTPPCNSTSEDICQSYINANYIMNSNSEPVYIAAEGPMPNTVNDFWAMVFQERTPVIVMITNLEEKSCGYSGPTQRKCEKYWPDTRGHYGSISVSVISTSFYGGIQIRHIHLDCGGEEHRLRHIWFTKWLDHRLPVQHITQVLKVIVAMDTYRTEYRQSCVGAGPVVVHCSAGIGRTCTFIAIAQGVEQLCETPEEIDVFSIVSRLRMQRYGAVQLPEQYAFIYLALQRMEKLLPVTPHSDPDRFPACLAFSEACNSESPEPENNNIGSVDALWNCSNF